MNNFSRTCCGLLLLLAGCNTLPPVPALLNPSRLPSQLLQINTERDTTITLSGGTIVKIPAQALKVQGSTIANLEIKEALTIEQMLAAGLRTQSNGDPLRSGGMLYINTADNSNLTFRQPIQLSVPAREIAEGMQLYKGEPTPSGINWTDPKPLPPQNTKDKTVDGKALFEQNCRSCHQVNRTVTGPALNHSMENWKYDTAALYAFTANSSQLLADGHCYSIYIFNQFNKQVMPGFPTFSKEMLDALYKYIDEEALKLPEDTDEDSQRPAADSCAYYTAITELADSSRNVDESKDFTTINYLRSSGNNNTAVFRIPTENPENLVRNDYQSGTYYNIQINATGWHNLDMPLHSCPDFLQSELSVTVANETADKNISVFLLVPSKKILLQGGRLKDGKSYGFYKKDGTIPLPPGKKAMVVVIAESKTDTQLYFGSTDFIISAKQQLDLQISPTGENDLLQQISKLRLPEIEIKIDKKALPAEKKRLENEALRVKEKVAFCNCQGYSRPTTRR